ncbi:hypothetical protein [Pseudomonas graminis]|uniref:hypothetical protein n=1 Tax=Pseudomonas graminis TaxID=158627 RepID=UPI003C1875E2
MQFDLPNKVSGYCPEVIQTLASLDDSDSRHSELGLHHPADIFLFALTDALESIERLSKRVVRATNPSEPDDDQSLDNFRIDIFNVLFFCNNFLESCQSILKSLFAEDDGKKFTKATREFSDSIKSYKKHTSCIVNAMKHKHRRIRPFTFSGSGMVTVGYYIEGKVDDDILGPDPSFHEPFNNMNTGYSLNKDIPYHLFNLYKVSSCLDSVIRKFIKNKTEYKLKHTLDSAIRCLEVTSSLPLYLLPNEFNSNYATVIKKKTATFVLSYPSKQKPKNSFPYNASINTATSIGIKARSFSPPYLRPLRP